MNGFIYIIYNKLFKDGQIKIGSTYNYIIRYFNYQTYYQYPCKYIAIYKILKSKYNCYQIDYIIQNRLNNYRYRIYGGGIEHYNINRPSLIIQILFNIFDIKFEKILNINEQKFKRPTQIELINFISKENLIKIKIPNFIIKQNNNFNKFKLKSYQSEIIFNIIKYFKLNNKGIISLPPGMGKTIISLYYSIKYHHKILILCTQKLICNEFFINLNKFFTNINFKIYIINSDNKIILPNINFKKYIIITTYRSSFNYHLNLYKHDIIIYDEAHHTAQQKNNIPIFQNNNTLNYYSKFKLFLTATPKIYKYNYNNEKEEYLSMDDSLIYGHIINKKISLIKAIDKKFLSPYKFYISNNYKNPFGLIEELIKLKRQKILLYFNYVWNSKKVYYKLQQKYQTFHLDGTTNPKQREYIIKFFEYSPNLTILCNVNVISEGVSINNIDTIVFMEKRKSEIMLFQNIGRGLRLHKNKKNCIIVLSHNLNHNKFIFNTFFTYDKIGFRKEIDKVINNNNVSFKTYFGISNLIVKLYELKQINKLLYEFNYLKKEIKNKFTNKIQYLKSNYMKTPNIYYKLYWNGWYDFLDINTSLFIQDKNNWIQYCKQLNINSVEQYHKICFYDKKLPEMFADFYKNFTNFNHELNIKKIKRRR